MRIFMTGGSGFVGRALSGHLIGEGHQVVVLTRSIHAHKDLPKGVELIEGNPLEQGRWQDVLRDCQVVINLAGESIFSRWSKKKKEAILSSRIMTTRRVVEALEERRGDETLLISTSAVGYYGPRGDEEVDEDTPPGDDFLAQVALKWEKEALQAQDLGVRVVIARFGIVLGKGGGALAKMLPAFKYNMGSPLGSGRQWFPWIHIKDLVRIYSFFMENGKLKGPFNCTAPAPVTNRQFCESLARVMGKSLFLPPVPSFVIKMLLGEFGSMLLTGQKALPTRLQILGFKFLFPGLREALEDLLLEIN
ncbi:MAG TPA: TIGR01777 family protein [Desulfobacterales bacterium]|nr:TIGR01777 family protein [Desulfobacterales bacterium]